VTRRPLPRHPPKPTTPALPRRTTPHPLPLRLYTSPPSLPFRPRRASRVPSHPHTSLTLRTSLAIRSWLTNRLPAIVPPSLCRSISMSPRPRLQTNPSPTGGATARTRVRAPPLESSRRSKLEGSLEGGGSSMKLWPGRLSMRGAFVAPSKRSVKSASDRPTPR
jgi:hypothetical protein